MKTIKAILLALTVSPALMAQDRFATRNGYIQFFSGTPMENIEAHNRKVTSVFNASSGAIEFAALVKAFEFEKALMQEHFNENYMESNTFPKATFKGRLAGVGMNELGKPGNYPVTVIGDLVIHGVSRPLSANGVLVVGADGTLKASSTFKVKPEDHGIKVPGVVRDKIAKEIQVTLDLTYTRM